MSSLGKIFHASKELEQDGRHTIGLKFAVR